MRRRHLSLLVGLIGGTLLLGSAVLAANGPAKAKEPPRVLTDQSWANRVPAAAPEIKKIQAIFVEDQARGRLAAASALNSSYPIVRTYAALVLGAIGEAEQLEPLALALAKESDAAVQAELALAQVQIKHRLAAGHAEKAASVLAEAKQSAHPSVQQWAESMQGEGK